MHSAWFYRLLSEEICTEYAARTMIFQRQAFPTKKRPKVLKKTEFQTLASKKSNWQPCTEVSVDHTITHTHTHTHTITWSRSFIYWILHQENRNERKMPSIRLLQVKTNLTTSAAGAELGVCQGGHFPPKILTGAPSAPQNFPRDVLPLHWNYIKL